jgi:aldehyde dehydrogenase (NAD+)
MGPVVNRAQFDRVQNFIRIGVEEGCHLAHGGLGRPAGLEVGYYVQPTIFSDVSPTCTIAQEEIFGPVVTVSTFDSDDEAVEIANGTKYGLGGYVFSGSPARAKAIADHIRAGRVFINGAPGNSASPMGGYKQSGNGREMGVFGLEEFLETKAIFGHSA